MKTAFHIPAEILSGNHPPQSRGFDWGDFMLSDGLVDSAIEYYKERIESGGVIECAKLGDIYKRGIHRPRLGSEALRYYRLGESRGCAECAKSVVECVLLGIGMEESPVSARRLCEERWNNPATRHG